MSAISNWTLSGGLRVAMGTRRNARVSVGVEMGRGDVAHQCQYRQTGHGGTPGPCRVALNSQSEGLEHWLRVVCNVPLTCSCTKIQSTSWCSSSRAKHLGNWASEVSSKEHTQQDVLPV